MEQSLFARLGESDGRSFASGSSDATDAMHVRLGCRRDVVVDDVSEMFDVETAGGHVGGDEQLGRSSSHSRHHAITCLLIHTTVKCFGSIAAAVQSFGELIDFTARTAEHDGCFGLFDVEDATERGGLVEAVDHVHALLDLGCGAGRRVRLLDRDSHRIGEVLTGDLVDLGRHGGREENGLTTGRCRFENRLEVFGESHVEHLVGLVENHRSDVVEFQRLLAEVVECSAWSGHDHVSPPFQCFDLTADGLASVHRHAGGPQMVAVLVDGLGDLHGQFSGGDEDEGDRSSRLAVERMQKRQGEGGRLAGARGGLAENVVSGQEMRNRLALDRCGFFVTEVGERAHYFCAQSEVGESRAVDAV